MPKALLWSALLLGLMFSLPLVQPRHTNPITSFYSEWLAMVLGAAALLPLLLRRYTAPLQVPAVAFAPLALSGVLIVHLLLVKSPYPQQPMLAIVYLLWATALVLVSAALRRELGFERIVALLAAFMLAGGLLNALAGVLQHYEWRGPLEPVIATKLGYQVYGNLGQANHFSTHITLALASLGFLYGTGRTRSGWTIAGAAALLFVLALSGSRSSWIYLLAIAALAALRYRSLRTAEARRAMIYAAALLPGLAFAHFIAELPWLAPPTLHTTVVDRVFSLAGTQSERLTLWRVAWAMFLEHPLLGVGWGQFAWHNFMLTGKVDGMVLTGLYNHAHNLLLQLLAETGLIGGAIAAAAMVSWARSAARTLAGAGGLWVWACAIVLGVHSMLEYPLWNAHFLGIACVVLALGDTKTVALSQARLVRGGLVVSLVAAAWLSGLLLDGYYRLERVVNAQYADASRAALERAHREMVSVSAGFFLAPYVELAYARDLELSDLFIRSKIDFSTRVMRFAPTGMVAYRHAALNALAGNEEEARNVLRQAALAYPSLLASFTKEFSNATGGDAAARERFAAELHALAGNRRRAEVTP
jgi:O-antigen ligase